MKQGRWPAWLRWLPFAPQDPTPQPREGAVPPHQKVSRSEQEWRQQLSPEEFRVTRQAGTERAFTGQYWDHKDEGVYQCVCCGAPLFLSDHKFDSGCGWPSFDRTQDETLVTERRDVSFGMVRTEVICSVCDAHLGHVFTDGPRQTTGRRYCINSASLRFQPKDEGGPEEP